jgi:hypothetical protein
MKKLENILAENMRRFKTKNLNEDSDQNNNGYPDGTENSSQKPNLTAMSDPELKKYGFMGTDSPDKLKGKLVTSAHLAGVNTVAYFDNSNWNLPEDPFDRNKIKDKIHNTLVKILSKYTGGKLKNIWTSDNADLPPNITALALQGGTMPNITIDNGTVRTKYMDTSLKDKGYFKGKLDRKVIGTYDGKPFELETVDGLTLIYINGKLIDDEDNKYQEILNAVIDRGYELQDKMLMKKDYGINLN